MVLVSSASCTQHRALFLLALEPCVYSSPHFHIFPPSRHKAHSVLAIPCGCQGPVAGEGFRSHFIKQATRPRRLATHPTQRRWALSQLALVLTHWEPWGVGIQEDRSQPEGLGCCGQPGQLMQLLKDIHSLLGTYEPGGTQARPEQVGSLSSTVAEKWAQSQQRPNLEPQSITQARNRVAETTVLRLGLLWACNHSHAQENGHLKSAPICELST